MNEKLKQLAEKYNKTEDQLNDILSLIEFSGRSLEQYLIADKKYEERKKERLAAVPAGQIAPQSPRGIPIEEYNFASLLPTIPELTLYRERNIRKSEFVFVLKKMTFYCYRQGRPRSCSMTDYMFTWTKEWENVTRQVCPDKERFRKIVSAILDTLNQLELIKRERTTGAGFKKPYVYSFGSKNPWKDVPYINVKRWKKNITGNSVVIDDLKFLEDLAD